MHSFTVNCDTFSNEEKVAAVVPVTSVEVTCSEAMLALSASVLRDCMSSIINCMHEAVTDSGSVPRVMFNLLLTSLCDMNGS